jgi:hypothetical protein
MTNRARILEDAIIQIRSYSQETKNSIQQEIRRSEEKEEALEEKIKQLNITIRNLRTQLAE